MMLEELSEDLNSIKKIQSDMKNTLLEIKNNLQGNNSRVDEAENQITDLEHKKAKNNQLKQQEEKRIPKNDDSVSSLWDNCMVEKIQGLRSIIGRYKIGRGMLRIV